MTAESLTGLDISLDQVDPEIFQILRDERERQENSIVLIPSENYAPLSVLEASASVLANKYAEGYGDNRYYNGCHNACKVESIAIERACSLFGAEHANVQPHAGAQANLAIYYALLEQGDRVLAMNLDHGGHLTHGQKINYSGRWYEIGSYGVDPDTGRIDMDAVESLALEFRPRMIIAGASAYPRTVEFERFRSIADEVGAYLLADISHIAGLIAAEVHPSPVPFADVVTSTTHKTLRGPRGAVILCKKELARRIDRAVFPGIQSGPLMHVIAAKAVAFLEASTDGFRNTQKQTVANATHLAHALTEHGFDLVSGGTDNHLMLVDLNSSGRTGAEAADLLEESGIVVNKNPIPFDTRSPRITSGIRPGTPAVTSRGMGATDMRQIAQWMHAALSPDSSHDLRLKIREEIRTHCQKFPVYGALTDSSTR